jgi:hypothetical protein
MSEKELNELELEEAKASFGVDAEVPDPKTKEMTPPGAKPEDEDKKDNPKQGSSVKKTKVAMVTAMVDAVKGMKKEDLEHSYKDIMAALQVEGFEKDDEDEDDADDKDDKKKKKSIKDIKKIDTDDVDVAEDIKAMFNGEDLSEDFIAKATTIFESAIVSKVNDILESVTIDMEADLEVEKAEITESLTTKLDDYLEYVSEEWMKENELAVETGIKNEITENFMTGLKDLFTENYIDIPEEKVDLVNEMALKLEEMENSLNEEMEKNIELKKDITESNQNEILANVSDSLTESQAIKLKSLAEGVDFDNADSYVEKLETLKENYFPTEEVIAEDLDDEPLEIDNDVTSVDPEMSAYMSAITNSIR